MSRGVKEIRNKLDAIAQNHNQFGFKLDSQPIRRRREETCSYVYARDIIGRKDDVKNIVARLLDPHVQQMNWRAGKNHSCPTRDLDAKGSFTTLKIRTCLRISHIGQWYKSDQALRSLLANWICLRALDLSHSKIKILPDTLGKLVHLRYLDLSWKFDLEVLPNSITDLHNLETLRLAGCEKLRELPEDLCKLTKLRVLDTIGCQRLACMPRGMGKLNSLKKLPFLEVGERTSGPEGGQLADQLEEIQALKNLKGDLCIWIIIPTAAKYVIRNGTKGGYLSQHQHLTDITVRFTKRDFKDLRKRVYDIDEALLEDLQPHPNLRGLELEGYGGGRMPKWPREENLTIFLPNLVCIKLEACHNLQHLALLGKLHKLKCLILVDLSDLEYIQNTAISDSYNGVRALESEELFFPALEQLVLSDLPKLKGWWRDDSNISQDHGLSLPSFPCLSYLRIFKCLSLACMPFCPRVERLTIVGCNVNLQIMETIESGNPKLRSLHTSNVSHLKLALPVEAFQHLNSMIISSDCEVENLSEVEEVFHCCSSSLRTLEIRCCLKLKSVCEGLEHLTALEKEEGEDDEMPWRCLHHCLRSLELNNLPNLVNLPNGMRYLTALQSLEIRDCASLKSLPEWMPELTSLKQLKIQHCSQNLKERCRDITGEDWPNIQQIPDINIY
ncbi:hypothetical protein Cgig2_029581 [Carnegiea gigantea]|uniref:Uncharacterized protein n=1 Tax=Carnegiea gigantea TaxID=171969 RepID=A0A9Q1JVD9_9CARY|nr:hypothetical protein Cgig2_029581 [Carnegiea gigantea]